MQSCPAVGQSGLDYLSKLAPWKGTGTFSLEKMSALMAALGNPQDSYRTIHIAGTNGKGSVTAAVSSILQVAGARVGSTISPHLERIEERIIVNGVEVEPVLLNAIAERVRLVSASLGVEPSFFEGITACAFLAFALEEVEWAVVEVGLGGRLDATNVIAHPAACVITSIDLEHQEILGSTRAEIAREKAGIIKKGAGLIVGDLAGEALSEVVKIGERVGAMTYLAGRDFAWNAWNGFAGPVEFRFGDRAFTFERRLRGAHQAHNLSLAAATACYLGIKTEHIQDGLSKASWPGRLETLVVGGGEWLIDCAHNPAGVQVLVDFLSDYLGGNRVKIVFGALSTKNWREMLDLLMPFADEFIFVSPDAANPAPASELCEFVSGNGIKAADFGSRYDEAIAYGTGKQTVACGSIYMIGRLRANVLKIQDRCP